MKKRIILFASGSGTNVENLINYFHDSSHVSIPLIICNKPKAGVIARAENLGYPVKILGRKAFYQTNEALEVLRHYQPDLIVLAGFMWLLPEAVIQAFPKKIINIHPALLPKYGGKGMYGHHVHEAVKANHEKETGISVHYVNERYDEGNLILQVRLQLSGNESPAEIARRVHQLEYRYYPVVVEDLLTRD